MTNMLDIPIDLEVRANSSMIFVQGARRNISLTTDIIIGFPGESEEDFQATMDLLDEVQYDSLFSFKYKLFGDYQWRRPFAMTSLFHAIDIKNKLHSFDRATRGIVYS